MSGSILLQGHHFRITCATLSRGERTWTLDIETEPQQIDGETWQPYLYHHGLRLSVGDAHQLQGQTLSWHTSSDDGHPHPDMGVLYVFSHHETRHVRLSFGQVLPEGIELVWEGVADVLHHPDRGRDVPFVCACVAVLE